MSTAMPSGDPIVRELVRNALESVVDEMALTVVRTAFSSTLRDVMDFSTGFCNPRGDMVAQGLTLPLHLGAFPDAMQSILEKYGHDLGPGDVFILNDPYAGGMHLPDVFIIKPVFLDRQLLGFPATVGHQADVGGRVPGGNACDSTEIFQEGLRIGPARLYHRGEENETLVDLIRRNVRVPNNVLGDLGAQLSALHVGEQGLLRLARRYGPSTFLRYCDELIEQSESMARQEIARWPDGVYRFTDYLDDDGITPDVPIRISVTVTIRGSEMTVDFTGTAPQVASAINSSISSSKSAVWLTIRSLMESTIPNTAGVFRPIHVVAPEGSLVNSRPPAPVAARALTCFRIVDTVMGAMAEVLPQTVFAAGEGGISVVMIQGERDGEPFLLMDSVGCCWGGRPDKDGLEGVTTIALNISNIPVEIIERDCAVRIERYGYVPDTGGAGTYRGGLALERAHRLLCDRAFLQIRSDRRTHLPYPLHGGLPGAPSATIMETADGRTVLPTKVTTHFARNEMIVHRHAGGGGWGDPRRRDPEAVAKDVREGKVSARAAREQYCVAVLDGGTVDITETASLRGRRST
jgi:N-methylhydantoinase B